jgi:hypothetical protein
MDRVPPEGSRARPSGQSPPAPPPPRSPDDPTRALEHELSQLRLSNLRLRKRLTASEEQTQAIEARRAAAEIEAEGLRAAQERLRSDAERLRAEVATLRSEVRREQESRGRAEGEIEQLVAGQRALEERALATQNLLEAGWKVERENRIRAEQDVRDVRARDELHGHLIARELDRLRHLAGGWESIGDDPPGETPAPHPPPLEEGARALIEDLAGQPEPSGVLFARALELVTAHADPHAAVEELVGASGGNELAIEDAIARVDGVVWEASVSLDDASMEAPNQVEASGHMPVLAAGASTLLNAALLRLRSNAKTAPSID